MPAMLHCSPEAVLGLEEKMKLRLTRAFVTSLPVVVDDEEVVNPSEIPHVDCVAPDRLPTEFSLIVMLFSKATKMPFVALFGEALLIRFWVIRFPVFLVAMLAPDE